MVTGIFSSFLLFLLLVCDLSVITAWRLTKAAKVCIIVLPDVAIFSRLFFHNKEPIDANRF